MTHCENTFIRQIYALLEFVARGSVDDGLTLCVNRLGDFGGQRRCHCDTFSSDALVVVLNSSCIASLNSDSDAVRP